MRWNYYYLHFIDLRKKQNIQKNEGTVRLGKTPKVTQLVNGQDEIHTQINEGKKIK